MKLNFCTIRVRETRYSTTNRLSNITELDMVRTLKHRMRNMSDQMNGNVSDELTEEYGDHNGYIRSNFKDGLFSPRHIAFMDIDHEDFKDETTAKLDKMGIAYQVICSSESRYWIIADCIGSFTKVFNFINGFDGVDVKYLLYAKSKKVMTLRAYPRGCSVPAFEEASDREGSEEFRDFVQSIKEYWEKPHIEWMTTEYTINMI